MANVVDQNSDISLNEFYRIFRDVELPSYVKEASLEELKSDKLPAESYACGIRQIYPTHNKAACYVSYGYFKEKKASLARQFSAKYTTSLEEKLEKAAAVYGITEDIHALKSFTKEASTKAPSFMGTFKVGSTDVNLFPVETAGDVVDCARVFVEKLANYPMIWRKEIATNLVKSATEHGVKHLPDLVRKYAGEFFPDVEQFTEKLNYRMGKLASLEAKKKYAEKIAGLSISSTSDVIFEKLAACYEIEYNDGAYKRNTGLKDIVDSVFTYSPEKIASELGNYIKMGGKFYDIKELEKVSADVFEQAFGVKVARDDMRDVLPTLPLSDVETFVELSGVKPVQ